ncbi:MAG: hypothetical protein LC676_05550 [Loktanella sp.]|nr:hypothetical protein [Loktanella sp.]
MSGETAIGVIQPLGPFLALAVAILLYFKKRDDELQSSEAMRRSELYSRFLSLVYVARINVAKGLPITDESLDQMNSARFEIRVSCPNFIVKAADAVSDTVIAIWNETTKESSEVMRDADYFNQLDVFVAAARADLSSLRPKKFNMRSDAALIHTGKET